MYKDGPIKEFVPIEGRNMIKIYKNDKYLGSFYRYTDCADFLIANNYETIDRMNLANALGKSAKNNKKYKNYTVTKTVYSKQDNI